MQIFILMPVTCLKKKLGQALVYYCVASPPLLTTLKCLGTEERSVAEVLKVKCCLILDIGFQLLKNSGSHLSCLQFRNTSNVFSGCQAWTVSPSLMSFDPEKAAVFLDHVYILFFAWKSFSLHTVCGCNDKLSSQILVFGSVPEPMHRFLLRNCVFFIQPSTTGCKPCFLCMEICLIL